jgi:ribosomal protein S13
MNDPIVEEVRRYRDEHARKFDYNLDRICQDFRQKHAENVKRLSEIEHANNRRHRPNAPV